MILNVGYATGTSAVTGDNIDGGAMSLDFQKLGWESPWSGGFSIGYGKVNQTLSEVNAAGDTSTTTDNTISTVPVYLGGKYWLGGAEKRFQGYIGLAFGMYFSQLQTNVSSNIGVQDQPVSGGFTSETALGFGLGVPVGIAVSLGDSILLTANYTLNWLWENEFLENDILNTVSLGLGFTFGG
jgi:hypothetical protein